MALSRRTGQRFQASIWPGFVDAMTGLLLVLFFVLSIFMVVQFALRETITGQESELDALADEVSALAAALGLEEDRGADLERTVGLLSTTLSEAEDEATRQAGLIISLTFERNQANAALEAAQGKITAFEAQVAALISQRDEAISTVGDLQNTRDDLLAQQGELLTEQEALNLALAQARSEIDAGTEAARLAAARREALQALITDLRARNAEAETQTAQLTEELGEVRAALSEEEVARLAESAAAEALRERLKSADEELTAMTLALEAERKQAEDTLTLLAAAEAVEEELDDKLVAALLSLEAASRENSELSETASNLGGTVQQLETDRAVQDAQMSDLQGQVSGLTGQVEDLNAQISDLEARLQATEGAASEATALAEQDKAKLRASLAAALAAKLAAEALAGDNSSDAERQAALLATAQSQLAEQEEISLKAQRQAALLNQQVGALRAQLGELQALLDDAKSRDVAKEVQLQSLGSELNTALARVAAEERRRRQLEEEERKRLEAEAQDLERYRSEFFGQLRDLIGTQEGVRIVGDRFVFSSEVLFDTGRAELSPAGRAQIARIAEILSRVANDIPDEIDWVLQVDGHTDNIPLSGFGQYRDNWELSQARALSVVRFMVSDLNMAPERLSANGFGEFQPVNGEDSEVARAQNRRIEIKFTEK